MKIKGFITNLGKYNEGELVGEWITFPISDDDLNDVFARIGMNYINEDGEEVNTGYEEYFFTDWECDKDVSISDFGEYVNIAEINEIAENFKNYDDDLLAAVIEVFGFDDATHTNPDEYSLLPCYTDEELGEYYIKECYPELNDKLGWFFSYFDYEAFGRDCRLEQDGDFTEYGYVVRF